MQKTKLGISVGVFGALLYAFGYFGGYLLTTLLVGYVLFREENLWLRRTAVKVVTLMLAFSVLNIVIGLIPELISIVDDLLSIFSVNFPTYIINNIANILWTILSLAEKVLFVILGVKALSQKTVLLPVIDDIVNKITN